MMSHFFSCPPSSELLLILLSLTGALVCCCVREYDLAFDTHIYPAWMYGEEATASESEIYRCEWGMMNGALVGVLYLVVCTTIPNSRIGRCLKFIAEQSDPRS